MKFTSALVGLAALFSVGVLAASDCDTGPFHGGISWVGGSEGGDDFCATKWKQGIVITGIEAWANHETLRAIQFKYSDGSLSEVYGRADGEKNARIEWESTKTHVEKITLWGNGIGTRTGRIYVRLSDGKELDVGKDTRGQTPYEQKVDSAQTGGILLGAFGRRGFDVNALGFIFLGSKVKKIKIEDITLDDDIKTLNAKQQ
jgi:hypothetical protein